MKIYKVILLCLIAIAITSACSTTKTCKSTTGYIKKRGNSLSGRGKITIKATYCINSRLSDTSIVQSKVKGFVKDRMTGENLTAGLNIVNTKIGTMCDSTGYFELTLPEGIYKFSVYNVGNSTFTTKDIKIPLNTITEIYFYLGTKIIR